MDVEFETSTVIKVRLIKPCMYISWWWIHYYAEMISLWVVFPFLIIQDYPGVEDDVGDVEDGDDDANELGEKDLLYLFWHTWI